MCLCLFWCDRISSFQRRSDASNISLLFDAQQRNDEQESFAGLGYHLTPPANPPEGGHGGYYAIVSCPAVSNKTNCHNIFFMRFCATRRWQTYQVLDCLCACQYWSPWASAVTLSISNLHPRLIINKLALFKATCRLPGKTRMLRNVGCLHWNCIILSVPDVALQNWMIMCRCKFGTISKTFMQKVPHVAEI